MVRRSLESAAAALLLFVLSPLLLAAALGILCSDGFPVFYRARRMGLNSRPFRMFKFRTMRAQQGRSPSRITAPQDPRISPFGALLRRLKVDELPQLLNIVKGEMAFVGPRPEDPEIVHRYYAAEQLRILEVRPGLASPGTLYEYSHGEKSVAPEDPEASYVKNILPLKLRLDLVYAREASIFYDISITFRTLWLIAARVCGRTAFGEPPEMKKIPAVGSGSLHGGSLLSKKRIRSPILIERGLRTAAQPLTERWTPSVGGHEFFIV